MKRSFTKLLAAFALLAFMMPSMVMWGQTTVTWPGTTALPGTATAVGNDPNVTIMVSSTNTYTNPIRIYANTTITINANNGAKITSVAYEASSTGNYVTYAQNATVAPAVTPTVSGKIVTWTYAESAGVTEFTFKPSVQTRSNGISITYKTSGGDTPTTYTVTYDSNGGTGTMTDSDSPYNAGATVTVLDNEFTRTGYTFDHWSTAADDSGTDYDEGDSFTINANTTLYAQWNENTTPGPGGDTETVIIDFEDNQLPSGWTVSNFEVVSNPISGTSATNGSYACSTGGKTSASLTSNNSFENVVSISIDATRTTNNTNTSLYIDFCPDSNFGNNTQTQQVTDIPKNSWGTTTLTLSSTATGYIRIRWAGTTAIKYIDNIVITCESSGSTSDPSISAENVDLAYDAEEGTINYTINNPVEGGSLVASCDAEWIEVDDTPQTDAEGSIDFLCAPNSNFYAHSATVTLTYTYGDSKATVTKDVTVTQALNPDTNGSTIDYPIMVSEAIEAIDEVGSVSNIYVGGIVSEITASTSSYITFKMYDEDGDDYYLQAYHCTGNNFNEVAVGDQVVVYGTLEKYGTSVYQFASGCQLVSLIHPAVPSITVNPDEVNVDATPAAGEDFIEGTLDLTWENLEITDFFEDFAIQYYDAEGEELADDPNWIMVDLATQDPNIGEGYLVSYMIEENEGTEARTAYFKVFALGDEDYVYSNLVTITQAAPVAPVTGDKYVKVTSTADLTSGQYLIVYEEGSVAFDGSLETLDAASNTIVVILNDDEIDITSETAAAEFTIDITAGTIKSASGYYIGRTGDSNGMNTSATEAYTNTISIDDTGNAVVVASGGAYLRYNATSGQDRFRYFKSSSYTNQMAIQLYKKVGEEPATETYELTIAAYTVGQGTTGNPTDGWYLISSPVTEDITPSESNGFLTNTYDLYRFNQNPTATNDEYLEWENYKTHNFKLISGKGYLYANSAGTTLIFSGTPNTNTTQTVNLDYTEGVQFTGVNLVGNPFPSEAYASMSYYTMNEAGTGLVSTAVSTATPIPPCTGIFVEATPTIQAVTFSTTAPSGAAQNNGNLQMNLAQSVTSRGGTNLKTIDNVIVSFNEGDNLSKFDLFENNAKLYIPQGTEDYAIVSSEGQGELPISFKANEDGQYTLTISPESVEMNYLHLIDNMTGNDIDLLANPSYSFNAKTTDYESRFRLVFATGSAIENEDNANFAFYSNGSWIVNNNGEATLQVFDINGRLISSETINGAVAKAINQSAGIYMLRLVNGENVMVQKVVVR